MSEKQEILVLGCGVIGLSTAILLLREGFKVTIWAKDLPPNTTSNVAAAVWVPYRCGPVEKTSRWAVETLEFFQKEVMHNPGSGCIERKVTNIFKSTEADPDWKDLVSIERPGVGYFPSEFVDAYEFESVVMDTSIYMDYLVSWFKREGGLLVQREVGSIQEVLQDYSTVVNCTGLGSYHLFNDKGLYPSRGQVIKTRLSGMDGVIGYDKTAEDMAYIIPRVNDVILGGTAQDNDWNLEVNPQDTEDILNRTSALLPAVKNAEILEIKVGLRPVRSEIRLEAEKYGEKTVVHNYGHGGAGFTLSWGCALEVLKIIKRI